MPETQDQQKFVYDFTEGNKDLKDLLGGKGANLAEMTNLGLPVPPGFTITTEACKVYLASGAEPPALRDEVSAHLDALEAKMGKKLGQADDPLLVSVRSGAKFSMPGMMDTVLNIGLSDQSVAGLAAQAGDDRFAWDSYRRLIQMFGKTVLGVDGDLFEEAIEQAKHAKGVTVDVDLDAADLKKLVGEFKEIVAKETGRGFPQEPREQMDLAVRAVFDSWNGDRAKLYRRQERIPHDLGTAVNICSMVFGNLGPDSGTGVAFTRDPASGHQGVYGDYLQNAQGEDVVAGIRNTVPLADLERIDQRSYDQLMQIMETLETHYKDLCDIEFTIERGKLWMLQTRVGKRTAGAAFRIATQLVDQGLIDEPEALRRVNGAQLAQLMFPRFDHEVASGDTVQKIGRGIAASPGAAVGKAVFDSYTAVKWSRSGEKVILIRRETNPDDLDGMIAAEGILTSRGGKTSHAAVVARGMGKTCVCGAEELEVDTKRRRMVVPGQEELVIEEGDVVSIDGSSGKVYLGEVPVVPSPVVEYFEGRMHAGADDADELVGAVHRIMAYADRVRRLRVRANADNAEDAARARRFGAQGIGLCRTEHMFLGERREKVERLILAHTEEERDTALGELLPLQKNDFVELFEAMDGLPVTVRLLDPPLHEFLPDITELSVRVALAESRKDHNENDLRLLQAVHRLHEQNPMLGLRGVRLGLVIPGLFAMQVRAIAEAAAERRNAKGDPRAEIMIPLVGTVQELEIVREEAERVIAEVEQARGVDLKLTLGTMIELPRAALTAAQIAESADFFSFGTNDLTQTVWGFSRDDVEASFFTAYLEKGIFGVSPFETIDKDGVGSLVRDAAQAGRATRPDLKLGVCGEHGGDPESVHFFHEVGLDYVSCSPFRIPVARLEAGRAAANGR
ncbi:pyruvate, phosphate dikinase [Streptomyces rapamycinicus]|uniref:Pyruvate, phosphate dikinase n=2 Tax=Streptomyces rapamycinicus TaxID=1226757 RepID=A0A0A0NPD4_STRRN|nr:pyruvate, phosphate dikinase [Streptomyces rapamycinicus]AGP57988.1 pyruvate phosphate dikinase [Streptomyces rapamycinicus NRRL 5491]MBB4785660.1 pyruvate,orthophosphate dikinase [Streptomyces rapamycinicus]RLV78875.1 pyruvate, phosphate dikinase [Streptomyces rapamycinicus NRRL 5491]UTO65826.1 pyruvate, phosphate dikinase [Streptomyces rapamycinicus]UTP33781.1 pyruvate, phosphate dikinase [Streptomyces rapamycinicus NRRL 5491]